MSYAHTMATALVFEGADITDDTDCVLCLLAVQGRQWTVRDIAETLDEARRIATEMRAQKPEGVAGVA